MTGVYEPEPGEVAALLHNLLGDVLAEEDPLRAYHELTRQQAVFDALVSAIKQARGRRLDQLRQAGLTWEQVAEAAQLGTRQRAEQLAAASRRTG